MLNTHHFIWDDKTRITNQIYSSKNVTAGFPGYCIIHSKSQSSFAVTLKKTNNPIGNITQHGIWKSAVLLPVCIITI